MIKKPKSFCNFLLAAVNDVISPNFRTGKTNMSASMRKGGSAGEIYHFPCEMMCLN